MRHHYTAAAATERLKGYSSYGTPLAQEHGISTPMGFPAQSNRDSKKNPKGIWQWESWFSRAKVGVEGGQGVTQNWGFQTVFLGEASDEEPARQVLGCVAALQGGKYMFPCEFILCYPKKERSACFCPTGCKHHPQWETGSSLQVTGIPAGCSSMGGRKSSSNRNIQHVRPLEVLSGTRTKCLAPSCELSQHYPQWETHGLSP